MARAAKLGLYSHGLSDYADKARYVKVSHPVLPPDAHECPRLEVIKLSDMFPVKRPSVTAIDETREHNCFVHFDFRGQLDVLVIHNSGAQATKRLGSFTDMTAISLSMEASEVPDVVDRLQFSSRCGHLGRRDCSVWSRLQVCHKGSHQQTVLRGSCFT